MQNLQSSLILFYNILLLPHIYYSGFLFHFCFIFPCWLLLHFLLSVLLLCLSSLHLNFQHISGASQFPPFTILRFFPYIELDLFECYLGSCSSHLLSLSFTSTLTHWPRNSPHIESTSRRLFYTRRGVSFPRYKILRVRLLLLSLPHRFLISCLASLCCFSRSNFYVPSLSLSLLSRGVDGVGVCGGGIFIVVVTLFSPLLSLSLFSLFYECFLICRLCFFFLVFTLIFLFLFLCFFLSFLCASLFVNFAFLTFFIFPIVFLFFLFLFG